MCSPLSFSPGTEPESLSVRYLSLARKRVQLPVTDSKTPPWATFTNSRYKPTQIISTSLRTQPSISDFCNEAIKMINLEQVKRQRQARNVMGHLCVQSAYKGKQELCWRVVQPEALLWQAAKFTTQTWTDGSHCLQWIRADINMQAALSMRKFTFSVVITELAKRVPISHK